MLGCYVLEGQKSTRHNIRPMQFLFDKLLVRSQCVLNIPDPSSCEDQATSAGLMSRSRLSTFTGFAFWVLNLAESLIFLAKHWNINLAWHYWLGDITQHNTHNYIATISNGTSYSLNFLSHRHKDSEFTGHQGISLETNVRIIWYEWGGGQTLQTILAW